MADIETRLAVLEQRLQEAEDRLAIYQLIASYGPAVDTLDGEAVSALWTEDGVYDTQSRPFRGQADISGIVNTAQHRSYVERGGGHVMSLPQITIDGDTAVAIGYSNVFTRDGKHWRVERTSSNRWELVRTLLGWRVKHRLNRLLDGTEAHRDILARASRG
ncbi:MAG: nuclear transport factor 2 family protein [Burkholderiaceae bacterium]|nr:nuclear transport factor 2 family protein [Burkholderiaceae bacterium]